MSGVKGLSGRKSKRDEEKRLRVIERAWDVIDQYLNDPSISRINKVDIATKLVIKDLPTQLETTNPLTNIVIVRDGNKTKAVSGQVCVQQDEIPSDGQFMGNRQEYVGNIAGNVIQRADPKQLGDSVS